MERKNKRYDQYKEKEDQILPNNKEAKIFSNNFQNVERIIPSQKTQNWKKEGTNYSRKNTAKVNSKHISELGNKNGHRYDDWNYDWIIIDSRF